MAKIAQKENLIFVYYYEKAAIQIVLFDSLSFI